MSKKSRAQRRRRFRMRVMKAALAVVLLLAAAVFVFIGYQMWDGAGYDRSNTAQTAQNVTEPEVRPSAMPVEAAQPEETPAVQETQQVVLAETQQPSQQPEQTPQPEPEGPARTVTLTFTGDCTLGGNVNSDTADWFHSYYENYGPDYFFENFRELFEQDDLTIINLECVLPAEGTRPTSSGSLRLGGRQEYVAILTGSGVEVCNLANNHTSDFGSQGLRDTVDVLEANGLGVYGYENVYTTEINGITISFMGFTRWESDAESIYAAVSAQRPYCDLLIVTCHWNYEKQYDISRAQFDMGHAAVDAGADLVVGHHPHVISGVEKYKGKYIVYSLGNFCFGGNKNPFDSDCYVFQQQLGVEEDGTVVDMGINIIPTRTTSTPGKNDLKPVMLTGEEGMALLGKIREHSPLTNDEAVWMEGFIGNQSAQ